MADTARRSVFGRQPGVVITLAVLSVGLIGWVDYFTGPDISLILLYLIPISAVAWYSSLRSASWLTGIAAVVWFLVDFAYRPDDYLAISIWNTFTRLLIFGGAAILSARTRSERHRAAAALRATEDRLFLHVENAPLGIIEWDADFVISQWNPAAERIFGYSANEAVGRYGADLLVPPNARAQVDRVWEELITGTGGTSSINENLTKDGATILCEWHNVQLTSADGSVKGVASFVRDITEQRRLHDEVVEHRALLEAVVDGVPTGIALLRGPGFVHELVNPAQQQIAPGRAMVGRPYASVWPELSAEALPVLNEVFTHGQARRLDKVVVELQRSPEGSRERVHLALSCVPLKVRHHQDTRLLVLTTDSTEHARLEAQFWQAQKMEAIGQLAGGIAHDFNNLLSVILGYCDVILNGLEEQHPQRQDLSEIRKAGEIAASLTQQLLAFSRRQVQQLEVQDLNLIVSGSSQLLSRLLGEDIDVAVRVASHPVKANVDKHQIEQVLMNLAVNARDAMPDGGHVTIETARVVLDAGYAVRHAPVAPGPYVMLAVSDTGCGMTPEVQASLFEPFFTTKGMGKGTGLGLATVYGIVKQSGGYIWVYSEPGQGTTFKVYLPAVEALARPAAAAIAEPVSGGGRTILLVEDEQSLRTLMKRGLTSSGYVVLAAAHPDEAVEICQRHTAPITLLLTDVVLPGMNGRALAERLTMVHPEMRVLYMSGYTDNAIVHHGVLEAGTAFIQKPFTPAVLAQKVRDIIGG